MSQDVKEIADKYVRAQLAIMDGSAEAGIARIGWTQFQKTVNEIVKVLKSAGRQP